MISYITIIIIIFKRKFYSFISKLRKHFLTEDLNIGKDLISLNCEVRLFYTLTPLLASVLIINCLSTFFVRQRCVSSVVIMYIFLRDKIICKNFNMSFNFNKFIIFKSLKIGLKCSEYGLNVTNLTLSFKYLLIFECAICRHYRTSDELPKDAIPLRPRGTP